MNHTDQARFMWKWANQRGERGVHSWELRDRKVLNPSQRSKDIADHVPFWTKREGRGSRYWTDGTQPPDATPVRPNNDVGSSDEPLRAPVAASGTVQPLSVEPAPADTTEPVAIVRDWDGKWKELPASQFDFKRAA